MISTSDVTVTEHSADDADRHEDLGDAVSVAAALGNCRKCRRELLTSLIQGTLVRTSSLFPNANGRPDGTTSSSTQLVTPTASHHGGKRQPRRAAVHRLSSFRFPMYVFPRQCLGFRKRGRRMYLGRHSWLKRREMLRRFVEYRRLGILTAPSLCDTRMSRGDASERAALVIRYHRGIMRTLHQLNTSHYRSVWSSWREARILETRDTIDRLPSTKLPSPPNGRTSSSSSSFRAVQGHYQGPGVSRVEAFKLWMRGLRPIRYLINAFQSAPRHRSSSGELHEVPFLKTWRLRDWFGAERAATTMMTEVHCCNRCGVWMNHECKCHCSLQRECFPCARSRLRCSLGRHHSNGRRRRAVSLPACLEGRERHNATNDVLDYDVVSLQCIEKTQHKELSSSPGGRRELNEFLQKITNAPTCDVRRAAIVSATAEITPLFVRILPPTHYLTLLHGLNGAPKDLTRLRGVMLAKHFDLHCYVPDCYSAKAMSGVATVTAVLKDYLFKETQFSCGTPRLPSSPDLLSHVLPQRTLTQGPVLRFPYGRYADGMDMVWSQIFLSFVGHSLGGVLARSIIALDELHVRQAHITVSATSNPGLDLIPPRTTMEKSDAELTNFATFASPHNGTFEDILAVQAMSFLLPTGRELMRLAAWPAVFPLAKFNHLILYGNVANDFLVGPYTSLLLDPDVLRSHCRTHSTLGAGSHGGFPASAEPSGSQPSTTPGDGWIARLTTGVQGGGVPEFPRCVRNACLDSCPQPVEIDVHGMVVEHDATTSVPYQKPQCTTPLCIHTTTRGRGHPPFAVGLRRRHLSLGAGADGEDVPSAPPSRMAPHLPHTCSSVNVASTATDRPKEPSPPVTQTPLQDRKLFSSFRKQSRHDVTLCAPAPPWGRTFLKRRSSSTESSSDKDAFLSPRSDDPDGNECRQALSPDGVYCHPLLSNVRYLSRLPWKRFGVYIPSTLKAHNCIIWHARIDTWNLGRPIVAHFADHVFVHP